MKALWNDLDATTRRVVAVARRRLVLVLMAAVMAGSASRNPLLGFTQIFELCSYGISVGAVCRALVKREQPQAASMNAWDEAIGFALLALLAHIAIRFVR